MAASRDGEKQNITISLSRRVLKKAKVLAARRETSISGLLAQKIEFLVSNDEAYERSERQALAFLDHAFHLGGVIRVGRTNCMNDRTFVDTNVLITRTTLMPKLGTRLRRVFYVSSGVNGLVS